jgi:hypothetical protein
MKLIESKTLATAAASIEFTSIPQDGTDLTVKLSLRSTGSTVLNGVRVEFNGNTSSVYSVRNLQAIYSSGPNSTVNPYNVTNAFVLTFMPSPSQTANTFNSVDLYVPNYASTAQAKSVSVDGVSENNSAFSTSELVSLNIAACLFNSTTAITSIKVSSQEGHNLASDSTISLYKITKGSDGIVTTS